MAFRIPAVVTTRQLMKAVETDDRDEVGWLARDECKGSDNWRRNGGQAQGVLIEVNKKLLQSLDDRYRDKHDDFDTWFTAVKLRLSASALENASKMVASATALL